MREADDCDPCVVHLRPHNAGVAQDPVQQRQVLRRLTDEGQVGEVAIAWTASRTVAMSEGGS